MVQMRLQWLRKSKNLIAFSIVLMVITLTSAQSLSQQASITGSLKWSDSYQAAMEAAKKQKQPVLIKFEASWCTWCKKMDQEVFTEPEVIKELTKFVCIKVDVDKQRNIAQAYKIKSLPRTIVVNIYDEIVGDWLGFHEAAAFSKLLREVAEYTHTVVGTTSAPTIDADAVTPSESREVPQINPNNTDELIGLLGHRNPGICRRVTEILIEKGPEILQKVVPALESKYLGTRIAAWKVIRQIKGNQYKFDPWASSPERAKAISILKAEFTQ